MTTAYTSLLGLALPVTGELSGTWGDTVNTAITSLLDTAIAGTTSITTDADITLSTTTGASNQARQAIILWNPASGTVTRNITAPAQSKMYVVINASGGTQSVVIRGAGPTTGVTIAKGESATVAWNGSDFVKVSSSGGAITFTDLTVTGNTILGDAAADTLTVNATSTFNAPVSFAGLVRLPSTGRSAAAALTVTAPAFLYGVASTYTDTTSSGTIAAMAPFYSIAQPTLSTSNVTTYTNAATLYIANAPAAGGSATITNPYSLYIAAGNSYFADSVTLGSSTADTLTVNSTITSNLIFTDNTYDIGASGATRPRDLFLSRYIKTSSLTETQYGLGIGLTPTVTYGSNSLWVYGGIYTEGPQFNINLSSGNYEFVNRSPGGSGFNFYTNVATFLPFKIENLAATTSMVVGQYGIGLGTTPVATASGRLQIANQPSPDTQSTIGFISADNATIASLYNTVFQADSGNTLGTRAFGWRFGGKGYSDGTEAMALNQASGCLNVGTAIPAARQNYGRVQAVSSTSFAALDPTAQAGGVGGQLLLGGNYRSTGDYQPFVKIAAYKSNSTDGNFSYQLRINTTKYANSAYSSPAVVISEDGYLGVGGVDPTGTGQLYVYTTAAGGSMYWNNLTMTFDSADGSTTRQKVLYFRNSGIGANAAKIFSDNSLYIGSGADPLWYFASAGNNLGFCTTTPGNTIDIQGRSDLPNPGITINNHSSGSYGGLTLSRGGSAQTYLSAGGISGYINAYGGILSIGSTSAVADAGALQVFGGGATASSMGFNNTDNATLSSKYSMVFQCDNTNTIGGRSFTWRQGGKGYSDGTYWAQLSGGKFYVNTTSGGGYGGYVISNGFTNIGSNQFNIESSVTDFEWVLRTAGGMRFYVNSASTVATLTSGGVWTDASDARYKENITDTLYGLSTLMALKPRSYNLIGSDRKEVGFIAQEVLSEVPELVHAIENSVTNEERYTLSYGQLSAVIVKAVQELKAEFDAYKASHP